MVWGGAEYLVFDSILSTIFFNLLFILSNINIYVSNTSLLLLLFVNSFSNCSFQPGDCFSLLKLILVQNPWEPFLFLLISVRSGPKLGTCSNFHGNYSSKSI